MPYRIVRPVIAFKKVVALTNNLYQLSAQKQQVEIKLQIFYCCNQDAIQYPKLGLEPRVYRLRIYRFNQLNYFGRKLLLASFVAEEYPRR